jgi:hypothetical protein
MIRRGCAKADQARAHHTYLLWRAAGALHVGTSIVSIGTSVEPDMPSYRFHYYGKDNQPVHDVVTELVDDATAVKIAEEMVLPNSHGRIEIWQLDRLVHRIEVTGWKPKFQD